MRAVKGALSGRIAIPNKLMPELVVMSMSHNGWTGTYNQVNEIVARKRKATKASGIGYEVDYAARIWWEPLADDATKVTVEVTDRDGHVVERDCKQESANLIQGIDERASSLVQAIASMPKRETYGNARWATTEDLDEAERLTDELSATRFLLGVHAKKKFVALTENDTERHAIICGPTGCGKTSTLFIPNLLHRTEASAIVTEATAGAAEEDYEAEESLGKENPDLLQKTAGYRQRQGHKIYYFNPDDLRSHRINPVQGIRTIRQATRLTNILRTNTKLRESHSEQFWEDAETNLLSSLIMYAAGRNGDLAMVRQLLREGPEGLSNRMLASNVAEARGRFKDFLQWGTDNTRTSIVIGLIQRLELWTQPRVVALTQATDVDFSKLNNELFTFYLAVPQGVPELKPLAAIIFTYLINYACARKFAHPMSLYLDEFTNFGYLPDFPHKMSIIRHQHLPAVLGLQDFAQAEELYGQSASLFFTQTNAQIYFKPNSLAQAKIISERLGVENVYERTVSGSCEITEKEFGRDLMTAGAVQTMNKGKAIVFLPDGPPAYIDRLKPQDFDEMTAIPPPAFRKLVVDDRLVSECEKAAKPSPVEMAQGQEPTSAVKPQAQVAAGKEQDDRAPTAEKAQEEKKDKKQKQYNEYGDRMPSV